MPINVEQENTGGGAGGGGTAPGVGQIAVASFDNVTLSDSGATASYLTATTVAGDDTSFDSAATPTWASVDATPTLLVLDAGTYLYTLVATASGSVLTAGSFLVASLARSGNSSTAFFQQRVGIDATADGDLSGSSALTVSFVVSLHTSATQKVKTRLLVNTGDTGWSVDVSAQSYIAKLA